MARLDTQRFFQADSRGAALYGAASIGLGSAATAGLVKLFRRGGSSRPELPASGLIVGLMAALVAVAWLGPLVGRRDSSVAAQDEQPGSSGADFQLMAAGDPLSGHRDDMLPGGQPEARDLEFGR